MEFLRLKDGLVDESEERDRYRPSVPTGGKERVACGGPQCANGWRQAWKDRRRPFFEGQWACSARCLRGLVEAAVRRERSDGTAGHTGDGHQHRVPLGLMLLSQGLITHPQLQYALEAQRRAGSGRIGRWLIQEFGLREECVTQALSVQWSCPVLPMEGFDPTRMALAAPRFLVESLGMVPLRVAARRILYLAFEDKMDAAAAVAIERMSGLKVESGLVDGTQLRAARNRLLQCDFVEAKLERVSDQAALVERAAAALDKMQPRAARLVRLHHVYWLRMWLEPGVMQSDDGGLPTRRDDMADRIYRVATDAGVTAF